MQRCMNSTLLSMHMAVQFGHKDIVKLLSLEMHCDSTSRNANNHTALHLAINERALEDDPIYHL